MKDLQWVPVKKDDLFFIEAGTIHAIGAGALVAEMGDCSSLRCSQLCTPLRGERQAT